MCAAHLHLCPGMSLDVRVVLVIAPRPDPYSEWSALCTGGVALSVESCAAVRLCEMGYLGAR